MADFTPEQEAYRERMFAGVVTLNGRPLDDAERRGAEARARIARMAEEEHEAQRRKLLLPPAVRAALEEEERRAKLPKLSDLL